MDWGWNPETFASLFTGIAAVATSVLAFFTWRLATRTTELAAQTGKDVDAQWVPVLVPRQGKTLEYDGSSLVVPLENVGHGAAMRAFLEIAGTTKMLAGPFLVGPGAEADPRMGRVPDDRVGAAFRLLAHYHDVPKARSYLTTMDVVRDKSEGSIRVINVDHTSSVMPTAWPPTDQVVEPLAEPESGSGSFAFVER